MHPCTYVQDVMAIGEYGKKIMQDLQRNYVASISAQFIEHDETVGRGLWNGGDGEIRTLEWLSPLNAFQAFSFDRSDTSPEETF